MALILHRKWKLAKGREFKRYEREILCEKFPAYNFLSQTECEKLELRINFFLQDKRIEGIGGLYLSPEMKLLIAAHACLMLINLELKDIYPGLKNIYVTPDSYVEKDNPVNPYTGVPDYVPRLGESWKRGPIVLSWEVIGQEILSKNKDHNLIIHEFAHHLDQQDGYFDGTPQLSSESQYLRWAQVMGKGLGDLRKKVREFRPSDIDAYGATNEAEFFSVCTEYFFTDPVKLFEKHPDIYQLYLDFFKLDPRRWRT